MQLPYDWFTGMQQTSDAVQSVAEAQRGTSPVGLPVAVQETAQSPASADVLAPQQMGLAPAVHCSGPWQGFAPAEPEPVPFPPEPVPVPVPDPVPEPLPEPEPVPEPAPVPDPMCLQ
jgi:hypothetical protein